MQAMVQKTRCFCHQTANYPSICIKTQKAAGSWVVMDENTGQPETYKIFTCGHAIHTRCERLITRLNQEFQENIRCPMCEVDWTRPSELLLLEQTEKQHDYVRYSVCLCEEKVRIFKGQKQEWLPTLSNTKAYPCGHGCHLKCHNIFWKIQDQQSNDCPKCAAILEKHKVEKLHQSLDQSQKKVAELHTQNQHLMKEKTQEQTTWNTRRRMIQVAVIVIAAALMRFGCILSSLQNPFGDLIICILAIALGILASKVLNRTP